MKILATLFLLCASTVHEVACFALNPVRNTHHVDGQLTRRGRKNLEISPTRRWMTESVDVPPGGGVPAKQASSGGTATISNEIFNLVKGIVGAGVLSLPAGIAAFGNAPSALIPASMLIALIGAISGYGFSLIGRVCSYTGATSYRECWARTVGDKTSILPATCTTLKTFAAILAYSIILADTSTALLATAGFTVGRTQALLGLTTTILLPLCWMKNLSSLAPFSLLGSIGMVYTAIAMGVRYFGKAYMKGPGKNDAAKLAAAAKELAPSFGDKGAMAVFHPSSFILVCMLSTAYMAHFNAPKFFIELKDNTIDRFNTVVSSSFGISVALFAVISAMGFLTFGGACSGMILNNYSNADGLMSLSRIAVAVSLIFSYPLAFVGAREGVLDLMKVKDRTNSKLNALTVALLSIVTLVAWKVKDVSFVLAMAGATLGNSLIYVFPALMFQKAVAKMPNAQPRLKKEVVFALGTAALGVVFGVIGAKMALQS